MIFSLRLTYIRNFPAPCLITRGYIQSHFLVALLLMVNPLKSQFNHHVQFFMANPIQKITIFDDTSDEIPIQSPFCMVNPISHENPHGFHTTKALMGQCSSYCRAVRVRQCVAHSATPPSRCAGPWWSGPSDGQQQCHGTYHHCNR